MVIPFSFYWSKVVYVAECSHRAHRHEIMYLWCWRRHFLQQWVWSHYGKKVFSMYSNISGSCGLLLFWIFLLTCFKTYKYSERKYLNNIWCLLWFRHFSYFLLLPSHEVHYLHQVSSFHITLGFQTSYNVTK